MSLVFPIRMYIVPADEDSIQVDQFALFLLKLLFSTNLYHKTMVMDRIKQRKVVTPKGVTMSSLSLPPLKQRVTDSVPGATQKLMRYTLNVPGSS